MSDTYTETHRVVGNSNGFRFVVRPDEEGALVELVYQEWRSSDSTWQEQKKMSIPRDMALGVSDAIENTEAELEETP